MMEINSPTKVSKYTHLKSNAQKVTEETGLKVYKTGRNESDETLSSLIRPIHIPIRTKHTSGLVMENSFDKENIDNSRQDLLSQRFLTDD